MSEMVTRYEVIILEVLQQGEQRSADLWMACRQAGRCSQYAFSSALKRLVEEEESVELSRRERDVCFWVLR